MSNMIKSVQLVSTNICYGPAPATNDEVEQHITISSSGRVWFSARNFAQYNEGKGFCRKKQMNIGVWKAGFLLELMNRLTEMPWVTDCGQYELVIRFEDGTTRRIIGPLIGNAMVDSYGGQPVSLTTILRRYIPVYALWGFASSLSPDYEGKKAVFQFAKKWEEKFRSGNLLGYEFEEDFGEACTSLGFRMDCGNEFNRLYPNCFNLGSGCLGKVIDSIQDVDLLGSAVFSQWRYLTHWTHYDLDVKTCNWFAIVLGQMKNLTKRKTDTKKSAN